MSAPQWSITAGSHVVAFCLPAKKLANNFFAHNRSLLLLMQIIAPPPQYMNQNCYCSNKSMDFFWVEWVVLPLCNYCNWSLVFYLQNHVWAVQVNIYANLQNRIKWNWQHVIAFFNCFEIRWWISKALQQHIIFIQISHEI